MAVSSNNQSVPWGYARLPRGGDCESAPQIRSLMNFGVNINRIGIDYESQGGEQGQFMKLLELMTPGDLLYITRLDRISRDNDEAMALVEDIYDSGIDVVVIDIWADTRQIKRLPNINVVPHRAFQSLLDYKSAHPEAWDGMDYEHEFKEYLALAQEWGCKPDDFKTFKEYRTMANGYNRELACDHNICVIPPWIKFEGIDY
jgi:hypothetical protein